MHEFKFERQMYIQKISINTGKQKQNDTIWHLFIKKPWKSKTRKGKTYVLLLKQME